MGKRLLIQGDMAEACLLGCIAGALDGARAQGACVHHLLTWQTFAAEQRIQLANLANPRRNSEEMQGPDTPPQSSPPRARTVSVSETSDLSDLPDIAETSPTISHDSSSLPRTPEQIDVDWHGTASPSCTPRVTVFGFRTAAAVQA